MSAKEKNQVSHWPLTILLGISSLINALLPLAFTRIFSPAELGEYRVFFLYVLFIPWVSCAGGVLNGLLYWAGQNKRQQIAQSWNLLLALAFFFSFVFAVGLRPLFSRILGSPSSLNAFQVTLFFAIFADYFADATIAKAGVWTGGLFSSVFDLFRTFLMFFVALKTHNMAMVLWSYSGIIALKAILGTAFSLNKQYIHFSIHWPAMKDVLKYALPVSFAALLSVLVGYSDQLILTLSISPAEFALYSLGCLTVPPILIFEQSVNRVLIPKLSHAFSNPDQSYAKALFKDAVSELFFAIAPAAVILICFAKPIVLLLFTAKYAGASRFLSIYPIYYLGFIIPVDAMARALGDAKWIFRTNFFAAIVSLALTPLLVHFYGAMGALVGLLLVTVFVRLLTLRYMKAKWQFSDWIDFSFLIRISGVLVFFVFFIFVLHTSLHFQTPLVILLGCLFLLFSFVFYLFPLRFQRRRKLLSSKKVLLVTQYLEVGGLERMILNLTSNFESWAPQIFVYDRVDVNSQKSFATLFSNTPIHVVKKGGGFSLWTVVSLLKVIIKENIDVIHSHDLGALIYSVAAKILSLGRVRLVHTQHSFVHLAYNPRYKMYEKLFTFFADELCVVSSELEKQYRLLGIKRKIHTVLNGVQFTNNSLPQTTKEKEVLRKTLFSGPGNESRFWILSLARINPGKGQDDLLKMISLLPPAIQNKITCFFVGPVTDKSFFETLKNQASSFGLDKNTICFAGPTATPDLWIQASDLHVSASKEEGQPLSPIEAIGNGTPALLSDIPGHHFLMDYARFFSLTSPQEAANILCDCIQNYSTNFPANKNQLYATQIRTTFSAKQMSKNYEALYRT